MKKKKRKRGTKPRFDGMKLKVLLVLSPIPPVVTPDAAYRIYIAATIIQCLPQAWIVVAILLRSH